VQVHKNKNATLANEFSQLSWLCSYKGQEQAVVIVVLFCHAITFDGLALLKVGKSKKQFFPPIFHEINKKPVFYLLCGQFIL
jgi:hypothetical protein